MPDGKYSDRASSKIHHIQDPVVSVSVSENARKRPREGFSEIRRVLGKVVLHPRDDFSRSRFVNRL